MSDASQPTKLKLLKINNLLITVRIDMYIYQLIYILAWLRLQFRSSFL